MTQPAGTAVPREARDFGSYELIAKLATGGMAEIFLARRTDPVGRGDLVVIKRILPHLADDEHFVTMFRDEAALASKLEHGNVCRVFSLGNAGGTWFIVMEYLHGVALSRLLGRLSKQKEQLDVRVAAAIVIQACEGLHHAHELRAPDGHALGVVHRDVSPPNIFLCADGGVKLLDFGIAKARGAGSKTRTGTVKGKNAYMSPEQILGKPLDRRSDIFALGAVLYELLTVKRLFHRESDFLTFKAITEEPIPDVRERRSDLPPALIEVVVRALARDVNGRFPTARDMADAVRAAVAPIGGPATQAEVAALLARDFAEELAARQALTEQDASAPIGADSSAVPSLTAASSSAQLAIAKTVVDRPRKGNTLPTVGGELAERGGPPPIPARRASGTTPPPLPSVIAESGTGQTPLPQSAQTVLPALSGTGEMSFSGVSLPEINTDLLGARRKRFAVTALVVTVLAATIALIVVLTGDKAPAAAVVPDAGVDAQAVAAEPRRDEADAGESREDIIRMSKFGFFSIDADAETVIYIDEKRVGVTPLENLPLSPGPHKVRAMGPKKKTKRFEITILGGQESNWGTITW